MIQPIGSVLSSLGPSLLAALPDRNGTQTPGVLQAPAGTPPAQPADTALPGQMAGQSPSALEKALAEVNDQLHAWSTGMRFDQDEDAQRLVISIVDTASGKVLRTIPSDAVLQVARMIIKLQGAGVDTQA